MTVHSNVYSVGTASVTLCSPSVEPQHVHLVNMNPAPSPGAYATDCFFQLGFTEQYNGGHSVWINNSAGSAFELRGGETAKVLLYPLESLSGIATQTVNVGVLRQEQQ